MTKYFIFFRRRVKRMGESGLWHENWQFLPNEFILKSNVHF